LQQIFLKGMTKGIYLVNVEVITDLTRVSMEHTKRMFIQRKPRLCVDRDQTI